MPLLPCALWLIFLGAALAAPLYWLFRRRTAVRQVAKGPEPSSLPTGILFLTPACMRALGRCADPARLRHMSVESIERRLNRAKFSDSDRRPTPEQYASWPEQARLLCAGSRDELEALQRSLKEKFGLPVPEAKPEAPLDRDPAERRALARLIALTLAFLFLSLLSWWIAAPCKNIAAPYKCPDPPVVTTVPPVKGPTIVLVVSMVELSSDLVFDYNTYEPISPAHRDKLKTQLAKLFSQFYDIQIISIQGHTDPIGATADNQLLGERRAQFIGKLIKEIMDAHVRKGQFSDLKVPVKTTGNGPHGSDFAIWSACFREFNLRPQEDQRSRPLVNLPPKKKDNRVQCDEADADTGANGAPYPACARAPIPKPGSALNRNYAYRAERVREMIACLAPMRHVEINFKSTRVPPESVAAVKGG